MAHIFSNAQNTNIVQSTINIATHQISTYDKRSLKGLERLREYITPATFWDAKEPTYKPKCSPETRLEVMEEIMSWINGGSWNPSMLWLHGGAGAGKTTLGYTIAERCHEEHRLIAAIFLSRTMAGRSDGRKLIPTIAYQLALAIPSKQSNLESILDQDPAMLDRDMQRQMEGLLLGPLNTLYQVVTTHLWRFVGRSWPCLILIDGLDECTTEDGHSDFETQCEILRVMALMVQSLRIPIRILIASRPESHIMSTFNAFLKGTSVLCINLSNNRQADKDIRRFLVDQFAEIRRTRPHMVPSSWPEQEDIERLVQKSSRHFIYASVVMKFINDPHHRPDNRLQVILGLLPHDEDENPLSQLDALYHHILSSAYDIRATMQIIGLLIVLRVDGLSDAYTSPAMLEQMLSLQPGDVERHFRDVSSLFTVTGHEWPIEIMHASLPDFFMNRSRSGDFFVDVQQAEKNLGLGILRLILNLRPETWSYITLMENLLLPSFLACKKAGLGGKLVQAFLDVNIINVILSYCKAFLVASPWDEHSLEPSMIKFFGQLEDVDQNTAAEIHKSFQSGIAAVWRAIPTSFPLEWHAFRGFKEAKVGDPWAGCQILIFTLGDDGLKHAFLHAAFGWLPIDAACKPQGHLRVFYPSGNSRRLGLDPPLLIMDVAASVDETRAAAEFSRWTDQHTDPQIRFYEYVVFFLEGRIFYKRMPLSTLPVGDVAELFAFTRQRRLPECKPSWDDEDKPIEAEISLKPILKVIYASIQRGGCHQIIRTPVAIFATG
ncbi:hypothetical protein NLJ89_g3193 [Agrocybe chaxingu]|uniref:NACHT domain-containing protein n=1 Tax=Agrocybe chaxingu TaxID=84603 RepID=A0A9W8MYF5_9AGAR|nr:hypothetical protein NLJ89_g3193 [Agrocybe chaxingu]